MDEIPIEFWGVVIVALSSIFTNVLTWFLNYRSTRTKFESETRARYVQDVMRDHYRLYNFLRSLLMTPIKEEALKSAEEMHEIMNERPYNFKATIINEWLEIYHRITLFDETPIDQMAELEKDVLERINYFEKEYEKMRKERATVPTAIRLMTMFWRIS